MEIDGVNFTLKYADTLIILFMYLFFFFCTAYICRSAIKGT